MEYSCLILVAQEVKEEEEEAAVKKINVRHYRLRSVNERIENILLVEPV
jgi:hypothetical protein